jgi:hypothetical protein
VHRAFPQLVRRVRAHAVRRALLPIVVASTLAACSGGSDDATTPSQASEPTPQAQPTPTEVTQPSGNPVADAYLALTRADHEALPGVIAALDEALASRPDDGVLAFYAGTMRLWRMTRARGAAEVDLTQLAYDARDTFALLERARELRPESEHAAAFLGVAYLSVGTFLRDEGLIATGARVLEDAVPLHPVYVNGVRGITLGALPRTHPLLADAAAALDQTFTLCALEGDDANLFVYPPGRLPSERRMCNDEGIVAHVWEGILLVAGDIAVKQGDPERARALYASARTSPTYDSWMMRDFLEQRIVDADDRAARYLDDDPANDPQTWMEGDLICVGCHASAR